MSNFILNNLSCNYRLYDIKTTKYTLQNIDTLPPVNWSPNPKLPLDDSLPFPWPDVYMYTHKQAFNPATFMTNAVAMANYYMRANLNKRIAVLKIIDSLICRMLEYTAPSGNACYILYKFPKTFRGYQTALPWTSAYASGAALVGLSAISRLTDKYNYYARQFFNGLATPIQGTSPCDNLWVSFVDHDQYLFFEEMPLPGVIRTKILNGHIRALTGLHRYYAEFIDPEVYKCLCAGIYTIEKTAIMYRVPGRINSYDLLPKYRADYGPRRTLSQQLWLYEITGEKIFLHYYKLFKKDIVNQLGYIPSGSAKYMGDDSSGRAVFELITPAT